MKSKDKMTASEILDMADDGRVLLFDRSEFLLTQIQDDKKKALVKRGRLIGKITSDLAKARVNNPATVPELKQLLTKLRQEQKEELRFL